MAPLPGRVDPLEDDVQESRAGLHEIQTFNSLEMMVELEKLELPQGEQYIVALVFVNVFRDQAIIQRGRRRRRAPSSVSGPVCRLAFSRLCEMV